MTIDPKATIAKLVEEHGVAVLQMSVSVLWSLCQASEKRAACRLTLMEFYERHYKPEVSLAKGVTLNTIECRENALKYWVEITGNPVLDAIDKSVMCRYVVALREGSETRKPLAPATIRKHCSAIMSVLDYAGPKSVKNRDAHDLIPTPPAFPPVHVEIDVSDKTPNMEEFEQILATVKTANADGELYDGVGKGDWWHAIYLFLYNTGLRYSDVMSLRWQDLKHRKGRWVLSIRSRAEKTHREKHIPLNTAAVAVLDAMPRTRETIFYWPKSERAFYSARLRLIRRVGLESITRGTFHAIRRMVGTYVDDAQLVLGHTSAAVTRLHYQSIERAGRALDALEQPKSIQEYLWAGS